MGGLLKIDPSNLTTREMAMMLSDYPEVKEMAPEPEGLPLEALKALANAPSRIR